MKNPTVRLVLDCTIGDIHGGRRGHTLGFNVGQNWKFSEKRRENFGNFASFRDILA